MLGDDLLAARRLLRHEIARLETERNQAEEKATKALEQLARVRTAMIAWAADQHDGHIYEDARRAFNEASEALGLPPCDLLGVPAELKRSE
jgi:hypothetical protein